MSCGESSGGHSLFTDTVKPYELSFFSSPAPCHVPLCSPHLDWTRLVPPSCRRTALCTVECGASLQSTKRKTTHPTCDTALSLADNSLDDTPPSVDRSLQTPLYVHMHTILPLPSSPSPTHRRSVAITAPSARSASSSAARSVRPLGGLTIAVVVSARSAALSSASVGGARSVAFARSVWPMSAQSACAARLARGSSDGWSARSSAGSARRRPRMAAWPYNYTNIICSNYSKDKT